MDHFDIILALSRTALSGDTEKSAHQVARLHLRPEKPERREVEPVRVARNEHRQVIIDALVETKPRCQAMTRSQIDPRLTNHSTVTSVESSLMCDQERLKCSRVLDRRRMMEQPPAAFLSARTSMAEPASIEKSPK